MKNVLLSAASRFLVSHPLSRLVLGLALLPVLALGQSASPTHVLLSVGADSSGQLGDGTTADHRVVPVPVATRVEAIAAGFSHSLFVDAEGTVWTMGANFSGQLGDGTIADRVSPTLIATGADTGAAGYAHSLIVKTDGTLWATGWNGYGQLGDGTMTDRRSPVQVATDVQAVAAGYYHTLFVKTDGTLWAVGDNSYGQLGTGTASLRTPAQIATGVQAVAAGEYHSLFVKTDDTLWAMGENLAGQLGDGTTTDRHTPVQIATGVRAVAAGHLHSLFVKTDGTLWAMGDNSAGQLGDGTTTGRNVPVQVATGVQAVAAGYLHSLFLRTDGTLWAMGDNSAGQLGDGTTTRRLTPVQVATGIQAIAAGRNHTLFIAAIDLGVTPPIITMQPRNQTATAGQTALFSVTADSGPAATYQWQRRANSSTAWTNVSDGAGFVGATTASLTVNATAAVNGDSFQCVVTNSNGSVTTAPATLSVVASNPLIIATFAGQAGITGSTDGTGSAARFNGPADVVADSSGNIYVADTDNHVIRKITSAGVVTTFAGQAGASGSVDGTGAAARFNHPAGVAVDGGGNVYVADTDNDTLRKITPAGAVTTLAGQPGLAGSADGAAAAARFNSPSGIVAEANGAIYVADTLNHLVRKVTPEGVVTTLAGQAGLAGPDDGTGATARFFGPQGLALDTTGNLYVADTNNRLIRKVVLATAVVSTVAGQAGNSGDADGPAREALFNYPSGVSIDRNGNLFIADTDNHAIRRITPAGVVSTVAGLAGTRGSVDGTGAAARFNHPTATTVDATGNIYIADTDNHTIRVAFGATAPAITSQPQSQTVTAGTTASFSVSATGFPSPTFQWQCNGASISGATTSTLSLTNAQAANAGSYTVTIANTAGSVTSNPAILTVNAAATPAPGGSGTSYGGGAIEGWFVGLLALLGAARQWSTHRRRCPAGTPAGRAGAKPIAVAPTSLSFNR